MVRLKAAAGCAPLPLGCAELGPLSCGARRRGSGCLEHICRDPPPSQPPRGSPCAGASGRQRTDGSRVGKEPGTLGHGTGPAPLPGTARFRTGTTLQSAPLLGKARAGFFLDGQNQTEKEGREGERRKGEKQNSSTDVGCHGRRYTGDAGVFSLRLSAGRGARSRRRSPEPARRGGETSVPALPAACPGAVSLTGT